jgi:hypothetical protein
LLCPIDNGQGMIYILIIIKINIILLIRGER